MSAFIVSDRTMQAAVAALDDQNQPCAQLDQLGLELYKLNDAAVQSRYPDRIIADSLGYDFRYVSWSTPKMQQLKSLNCLI